MAQAFFLRHLRPLLAAKNRRGALSIRPARRRRRVD